MQLVRVVVGRLEHLRGSGQRLVDVAVARRAGATGPAASASGRTARRGSSGRRPGRSRSPSASRAARIAPASLRATTPTKSFWTTTLTRSGIRFGKPSTLTSFALIPGGRTTRPCSIPGTLTFWMYSCLLLTLSSMSTCRIDWPTTLSSDGFFIGALPVILQVEALAADQLAVGRPLRGVGRR